MEAVPPRQLRILLADERRQNLAYVSRVVTQLGHEVVATATDLAAIATLTEANPPDVAIVVVGGESERALALIGKLVREAACPVIALLDVQDAGFIREAAKRGVFAYITNGGKDEGELESAFEIVLRRFAEYHDLEGAFGRRAVIERAKGILMAQHLIDEEAAFNLIREQSHTTNRKLIDIAQGLLDTHALLARRPSEPSS